MQIFELDFSPNFPEQIELLVQKDNQNHFEIKNITDDNYWMAQIARRHDADFWQNIINTRQIIQIATKENNFHYQPVLLERFQTEKSQEEIGAAKEN